MHGHAAHLSVARDTEGVSRVDRHAREEAVEVLHDDLLQRHEPMLPALLPTAHHVNVSDSHFQHRKTIQTMQRIDCLRCFFPQPFRSDFIHTRRGAAKHEWWQLAALSAACCTHIASNSNEDCSDAFIFLDDKFKYYQHHCICCCRTLRRTPVAPRSTWAATTGC